MKFIEKIIWRLLTPGKRKIKKIAEDALSRVRIIKMISDGFTIISAGSKLKTYYWSDIDKMINGGEKLDIYINHKLVETLSTEDVNFYEFIQNIPDGFDGFDYSSIRNFFGNLKGCKCCGLIAVDQNKCLACGFENWNEKYFDLYDSAEEYLRARQLDLFEPLEDENVEINNLPEQGFKSDETWVPIITELDYKNSTAANVH